MADCGAKGSYGESSEEICRSLLKTKCCGEVKSHWKVLVSATKSCEVKARRHSTLPQPQCIYHSLCLMPIAEAAFDTTTNSVGPRKSGERPSPRLVTEWLPQYVYLIGPLHHCQRMNPAINAAVAGLKGRLAGGANPTQDAEAPCPASRS